MNIKESVIAALKSFRNYLIAVQLNPTLVIHLLMGLPRYIRDRAKFKNTLRVSDWPMKTYPILLDWDVQAANLGEYFWQDLYVAKRVIKDSPDRHVDVGSRVDGFIAHLACVRQVEVFDIRPLSTSIENVTFTQWDLTFPREDITEVSDCVTCLHTLEHVGLGRYGDQIDPDGWKNGLSSLAGLVKSEGVLWLSVPIGNQRVEFNAHRVFSPATIIDEASRCGLVLTEFHYLEKDSLTHSVSVKDDISWLADADYALGIFHFRKLKNGYN
jgi:hypothetical protein